MKFDHLTFAQICDFRVSAPVLHRTKIVSIIESCTQTRISALRHQLLRTNWNLIVGIRGKKLISSLFLPSRYRFALYHDVFNEWLCLCCMVMTRDDFAYHCNASLCGSTNGLFVTSLIPPAPWKLFSCRYRVLLSILLGMSFILGYGRSNAILAPLIFSYFAWTAYFPCITLHFTLARCCLPNVVLLSAWSNSFVSTPFFPQHCNFLSMHRMFHCQLRFVRFK